VYVLRHHEDQSGETLYAWPQALEKARAADRIVRQRLQSLGLAFDEIEPGASGFEDELLWHGRENASSDDEGQAPLGCGMAPDA